MNWKFWQKKAETLGGSAVKKEAKPRDLPQVIGQDLVVNRGMDPDWVWTLRAVTREKEKGIFEFRLFDPGATPVKVAGFSSLNDHPELVRFEGWYEKNGNKREIIDRRPEASSGNAA